MAIEGAVSATVCLMPAQTSSEAVSGTNGTAEGAIDAFNVWSMVDVE